MTITLKLIIVSLKSQIMFLNIILTILVIVLITITVLMIRWWRKFGTELTKIIGSIGNTKSKNINDMLNGSTQSITELMGMINKFGEGMNNINKKNGRN